MANDGNDDGDYALVAQRLRQKDATLTDICLVGEESGVNLTELATLLTDNTLVSSITLRNVPLAADTEAALVSAITSMPNLQTIRLQCVGLTGVGARKLADCQSWSSSLVGLNLQDNPKLGPRGIKSLAEKLSRARNLRELNLCHCRMGNFGAKALGDVPGTLPSSLIGLDLGNNAIGNDGSWKLAEAMHNLVNLKSLKLPKNQIADDGASEIGKQLSFLPKLKILDMSDNEIADVGAEVIAAAIPKTLLIQLDLSHNQIGNEGAVALGRAITESTTLDEMDLASNKIGDEGASALAEALADDPDDDSKRSTTLTSLSLKDNCIGDAGAGAFVEHLDENKTLVTLDLSGNEGISSARLRILEMLLKHRSKPSKPIAPAGDMSLLGSAPVSPQTYAVHSHVEEEEAVSKARKALQGASGGADAAPVEIPSAFLDACTNHFDAQRVLSYGSFGALFEGRDSVLEEKFAVRKVVLGEAGVMDDVRKRMLKELVGLRYSGNDYISKMKAYAIDPGCYFTVYNVSQMTSLDECIADESRRARLPWKARLKIIHNVVLALEFLHNTRSAFHGDVKSANVFVAGDGTAQLIDCGVSRLVATDRDRFQRGDIVFGSRGYRCPRYERGSHKYGPESDMFSVGIVLAELCTGRLQNHVDAGRAIDFYYAYIIHKKRELTKDLDSLAGSWDAKAIATLCKIALASMDSEPMRRPGASTLVKLLGEMSKV